MLRCVFGVAMCLATAAACSGPGSGRLRDDSGVLARDLSAAVKDMAADPFVKQSAIEAGLTVRDLGAAAAGRLTPAVDRLRSLFKPSRPERTRAARRGPPRRLTIVVADPSPVAGSDAFAAGPNSSPNAARP